MLLGVAGVAIVVLVSHKYTIGTTVALAAAPASAAVTLIWPLVGAACAAAAGLALLAVTLGTAELTDVATLTAGVPVLVLFLGITAVRAYQSPTKPTKTE